MKLYKTSAAAIFNILHLCGKNVNRIAKSLPFFVSFSRPCVIFFRFSGWAFIFLTAAVLKHLVFDLRLKLDISHSIILINTFRNVVLCQFSFIPVLLGDGIFVRVKFTLVVRRQWMIRGICNLLKNNQTLIRKCYPI